MMTPFTSIKDAAKDLFGGWGGGFASYAVYERFRNIDYIKEAKCPCFFLHGLKDTLIPFEHSVQLNMVCPNLSYLHLVPDMDHNKFALVENLIDPFKKFLSQLVESNVPMKKE
jgi:pimeloyl-ACP methyl ester carboxylesterase